MRLLDWGVVGRERSAAMLGPRRHGHGNHGDVDGKLYAVRVAAIEPVRFGYRAYRPARGRTSQAWRRVIADRLKHLIVGAWLLGLCLHWFVFPRRGK